MAHENVLSKEFFMSNQARNAGRREEKIVVLRPGALGDVVAVSGLLALAGAHFPKDRIALAAPGERGRFLHAHGLCGDFLDWESREPSWLFSDSAEPPPERLANFFSAATFIAAFLDRPPAGRTDELERRLRVLAPQAEIARSASKPEEGSGASIYDWLQKPLAAYLAGKNIPCTPAKAEPIRFPGMAGAGRYAVVHPGSGGKKKNWPVENFIRLAAFLVRFARPGEKAAFFSRVYVSSGEADGTLGEQVRAAVPEVVPFPMRPLEELAGLLANATLYIGNDSGVSHLAAAVANQCGRRPAVMTVFGPSDSAIWLPPGATAFFAGREMDGLPAETPCRAIRELAITINNE